MRPSRDGSAAHARASRHGVWRSAAPALAALCGLLGLAAQALTLTKSITTVLPATGTAGPGVVITVFVKGDGGTPSGTVSVNFGDGTGILPVRLAGGTATVPHPYVMPGSYAVTATYGGDGTFAPSTGIGTATVRLGR
jgi:hypothetical protein